MKLSIITVNLNNIDGLKKTISSISTQSWIEFEYIIIDGNSTDKSKGYIKEYAENNTDISIKWISENDNGVYHAMNKGINLSKGEYLLFLNSGDFLIHEEVLRNVFEKQLLSADILCGKCNISDKGKVIWTSSPPEKVTFGTLYNEGLAHQATFIKKVLFDTYGLYREDFKYNSDIDFWYKTIILNNISTQRLDLVISDYNLDGISNKEKGNLSYTEEMNEILAPFNSFRVDYDQFNTEKKEMSVYYWLMRQKCLNKLILFLYYIAKKLKGRKK